MNTAGIYIHIPFCVRKCGYCDFLSAPSDDMVQYRYAECVADEIRQFVRAAGGPGKMPIVDTIFLGGGTPSILPLAGLEQIVAALTDTFTILENVEFTIECNPGTADREKFDAYRGLGMNRLSLGMQSAVDQELKNLGRIHTCSDAIEAFYMAREAGFENINIDLMSAIPGQTMESCRFTLQQAVSMGPEHLSAYSLIVEEDTPFYERYYNDPPVDEDTDRAMYYMTRDVLRDSGYERYEISNYARKGFACRHNMKYWSGGDYIGFGLGASSKIGGTRYKNETELVRYMAQIRQEKPVRAVEEILGISDEMSEFFVLGLRKSSGVSLAEFRRRFSVDMNKIYGECIERSVKEGLLTIDGDRVRFTDRGLDVSNYVLCRFIEKFIL